MRWIRNIFGTGPVTPKDDVRTRMDKDEEFSFFIEDSIKKYRNYTGGIVTREEVDRNNIKPASRHEKLYVCSYIYPVDKTKIFIITAINDDGTRTTTIVFDRKGIE